MVSIKATCDLNASQDKVWDVISDVDDDPKYWKGITSIRNTTKTGNTIERDATVGFMGHEGHQVITLNPKESIDLSMASGPLKGTRQIKLAPSEDGKRTKLTIEWNFQFSKVPIFARGFARSQIESVTKEAIEKIASAAEGASSPKVVLVTSSK